MGGEGVVVLAGDGGGEVLDNGGWWSAGAGEDGEGGGGDAEGEGGTVEAAETLEGLTGFCLGEMARAKTGVR